MTHPLPGEAKGQRLPFQSAPLPPQPPAPPKRARRPPQAGRRQVLTVRRCRTGVIRPELHPQTPRGHQTCVTSQSRRRGFRDAEACRTALTQPGGPPHSHTARGGAPALPHSSGGPPTLQVRCVHSAGAFPAHVWDAGPGGRGRRPVRGPLRTRRLGADGPAPKRRPRWFGRSLGTKSDPRKSGRRHRTAERDRSPQS